MTQTPPPIASSRALYFRLLAYVRPYWKVFALAIVGMLGTAATEPVFPALMKYLLDKGFQTADPRLVWAIPLGIVLLFVVRGIFSYCTHYLMSWISVRLVTDLRHELFAKVLNQPVHYFHEQSSAKLISRIVMDVDNVNEAATNMLVSLLRESLTIVALLAYLLYLDWKLTLLTLVTAPVIAFIIKAFSARLRRASRDGLESYRQMSYAIEETVEAQKVIKIFGGQSQQTVKFHQATDNFRRSKMRWSIAAAAITPITHLAASIAVAIIIFSALSQTTGQAGASAGGFISFITAMLLLISPIKQLTSISPTIQRGLAGCESIFSILDTPAEPDPGQRQLGHARGVIEFDRVSFSYPGAERPALQDISFRAAEGQTVALVGASGGGKTTISALIPRFYSPGSGRILIDGIDIQELQRASLRQNIALVSQDIVLFNDTVEANIAFGARHTPRAEIIAAAKAANAWDFIEQLPDGLDTPIGEKGGRLSGGQRQRIAIARALLKNAPILILDEATSALDAESERQVQAALTTLMKGRTTLVIAHRLSTVEHADQILALDQGRIVERGTHAELIALGGYYASLNRMQT
ncbi:MAG: lipid A export permease/ATP-binding protein MsbA [Curvibacter sp.]|jgi:subfamily B ATP-binding cassette protein MsbA